ncbi:MAG: TetR/AcrR family transcriptional regulator [Hydrocarboniphaga sp.]|uniref:TetR/AcrR family transcriptional regulator n=1 Tax=Hydrocarboniphaga sp. TaxID=2033016 RepID=UPI00262E0964|nr:TetR/AcrR family transcriptional regulator [Hydrocarboniphaga sp.]MDB5968670.1 TetR/AcrR family transcriptional regulator [Hydrocarboniphaga sp.]
MNRRTTPKRRNAPQTKAKILAAAQQAFSEHGYSQSGIRDIAAIADVSSTLLLRYYGSKTALFEAALIDAMPLTGLLAGTERERFGEVLAATFMNPDLDIKPPSIIALSTGDADARDIATRVTAEHIIAPLAKWLGPPDAQVRALEIVMLSISFVLFSRQFPLIPARRGADKKLAAWLATTIQSIVNQPHPT